MKLGKKILNKRSLIIVSILVGTLFILTGCGKAEVSVKTYDKENDVETSKIASVENTTEENKVEENETTEETNKVEEKTTENQKTEDNEAEKIKELLNRDWKELFSQEFSLKDDSYGMKDAKVHLNMLETNGKKIYVVVVENNGSHALMYLIGKTSSGYVCNQVLKIEQSDILFDMKSPNCIVVESLAEYTTDLYAINTDTLTVEKFAYSAINPNDGEEYWYVNDKNVSYGRYYSYFDKDNLKSVSTWDILTKGNIDKIVK